MENLSKMKMLSFEAKELIPRVEQGLVFKYWVGTARKWKHHMIWKSHSLRGQASKNMTGTAFPGKGGSKEHACSFLSREPLSPWLRVSGESTPIPWLLFWLICSTETLPPPTFHWRSHSYLILGAPSRGSCLLEYVPTKSVLFLSGGK